MLKKFVRYVSLNILGMVSISFCIFMDTFFIARAMGTDGLAALNIAVPVYGIVNGVGHMLGVGGGARFSTLRASGREKEANQVFTIAVLAGVVFSLLAMGAGLFLAPQIAAGLGARDQILPMVTVYLRTILTMAPALVLSNTFASFVRNDGAPSIAMISTVILAVMNIILDYLFIFPLGLGMFGASLATMTGSTLGLVFLLVYFFSGKCNLKFRRFENPIGGLGRIVLTGMPSLIGDLSSAIVMTVFNLVLLRLAGNIGVAVFGIVANLSLILLAVFNGLGQGMQPLVSTAFGLQDFKNQRKLLAYSYITVLGLSLISYLAVVLYTDPVTQIFNSGNDPQLLLLARDGVRIYLSAFFFVGVSIVTIIYLSVTKAPRAALILSVGRGGMLSVPLVLILANLWGITGVWLAYPLSEFLMMLASLAVWRRYGRE